MAKEDVLDVRTLTLVQALRLRAQLSAWIEKLRTPPDVYAARKLAASQKGVAARYGQQPWITQMELAAQLGKNPNSYSCNIISKIESGELPTTQDQLRRMIAAVLAAGEAKRAGRGA